MGASAWYGHRTPMVPGPVPSAFPSLSQTPDRVSTHKYVLPANPGDTRRCTGSRAAVRQRNRREKMFKVVRPDIRDEPRTITSGYQQRINRPTMINNSESPLPKKEPLYVTSNGSPAPGRGSLTKSSPTSFTRYNPENSLDKKGRLFHSEGEEEFEPSLKLPGRPSGVFSLRSS